MSVRLYLFLSPFGGFSVFGFFLLFLFSLLLGGTGFSPLIYLDRLLLLWGRNTDERSRGSGFGSNIGRRQTSSSFLFLIALGNGLHAIIIPPSISVPPPGISIIMPPARGAPIIVRIISIIVPIWVAMVVSMTVGAILTIILTCIFYLLLSFPLHQWMHQHGITTGGKYPHYDKQNTQPYKSIFHLQHLLVNGDYLIGVIIFFASQPSIYFFDTVFPKNLWSTIIFVFTN
jgi:hypothetical protein